MIRAARCDAAIQPNLFCLFDSFLHIFFLFEVEPPFKSAPFPSCRHAATRRCSTSSAAPPPTPPRARPPPPACQGKRTSSFLRTPGKLKYIFTFGSEQLLLLLLKRGHLATMHPVQ